MASTPRSSHGVSPMRVPTAVPLRSSRATAVHPRPSASSSASASWWQNLKSNPDAEVLVDGKHVHVRARETDGAERDRLWTRFVAMDPAYAEYQRRTKRRLPVVVLEAVP
ncbi:MAG: nitroreductase family deazaflavin-dependent oxidoreductase [Chloroflexi bacterium]|nr:MAG: nitroreductase family deazaflavin-dependent oxidoreductase [Chloroflexota bacterium]